MEEAEVGHVIDALNETKQALKDAEAANLRALSDKTIHSASLVQDAGSITLAVIVYSLSKLIERGDNKKIKQWDKFTKKINSFLSLAIAALKEHNFKAYELYLEKIRQSITSISPNLKSYIQEVLRKAAINKASKIYEHGISMGQTADLLGITQWELTEYAGQKSVDIISYENPENIKERAKMALEFFS
ncbi:MAG: hypothetical protein AABX07_03305 [Nanoarchaeota archaeon]